MREILLFVTNVVFIQFKDVRFVVFKVICYINAKFNICGSEHHAL